IPLKATPHQVTYFAEKNLYPLIVSVPVPKPLNQVVSLVEQDSNHQNKSGGPWQTKATIPMQTSENALTVRMVTLLNTSSKENETLLAVGTAYVQGGEVAARGRILLFSLGKNTDNPQTLVSEVYSKELKGAISALASLQGHLLIASESIDGKHIASVTAISRESECTMGVNDKIGDSGERFFSSENSSLLVEAVDVNSTSDGEEQEKCCEELSNLQARQNEQGDSLDGIVDDTGSKSASSVLINATADRNCTTLSQIDEELLQEVVNMGFDRNQLVESLCNRIQNEVCALYSLLLCLLDYGAGDDLFKELWRLCAGPLMDVPCVQDRVFYFPQGHIEL
ncbi:hypothetical protein S83_063041, partial [Arachis hypogaea]